MIKKKQAIVIGTGGHSRVVLSILSNLNTHNIFGVLDLREIQTGETILGIPVIGSIDSIKEFDNNVFEIFLAIDYDWFMIRSSVQYFLLYRR